jgi:hypothetical protein
MDLLKNAQTRIEMRLPEIQHDLEEVGIVGEIIGQVLVNLSNELDPSAFGPGRRRPDLKRARRRFEAVNRDLGIYTGKSRIALKKIAKIVTEVRYISGTKAVNPRDNVRTIWIFNIPFTGVVAVAYVLLLVLLDALAWMYGESARLCDRLFPDMTISLTFV